MALESQHSVVAHHATAIVCHLDQLLAASFDVYSNALCTCVERVLQQFLHYRGRALHHFAGGDLVGDVVGENVDAAHKYSFKFLVRVSSREEDR